MSGDDNTHEYLKALAETTTISQNSKLLYLNQLKSLAKLFPGVSYDDILRQPKTSYLKIKKAYPNFNTQRSFIAAVKALLKHVDGLQCVFEKDAQKWNDLYMKLTTHINKRVESASLSEREEKSWIDWSSVLETVHKLGNSEYGSMRHLLLCMYTFIEPLRQDYGHVKLTRTQPLSPLNGENKGNYMVFGKQNTTLYLNTYKTFKKYNTLVRPIPEKLRNVILHSLRSKPRKWLFIDAFGDPYTNRNSYTKWCNRMLYSIFQPKKVTVSTLRHSFISSIDYNRALPGQLFKVAHNMGHSVAQQQMYRRKPLLNMHLPNPPSSSIHIVREQHPQEKGMNVSTDADADAIPLTDPQPSSTRWIDIA
jgi:hypothetical protein